MKNYKNTRYSVTENGEVYSNGVKLNPPKYPHGYIVQKIYDKGKYIRIGVHRMVAECYIDNPHNKKMVNHKDGNKANNHVSNLEWVTSHENHIHASLTGLKAKGESHGFSKLKNEQVVRIKEMLSMKVSQRKIANLFNVCQATIKDINVKRTWAHI